MCPFGAIDPVASFQFMADNQATRPDAELIITTDPSTLTESELRRLSVLCAAAQLRIEENLQSLRAPPTRNYNLLLDTTRWNEILLDSPDSYRGEQFLRQFFKEAVKTNHSCDGMLQALVHLMDGYISIQGPTTTKAHLLSAARRLIAELVVANSAASGVRAPGLKTIRAVLVQEELPANMVRAMEQARIMDRLQQQHHPQPQPAPGS